MRFAQVQLLTNGDMSQSSLTSTGVDMNQQVLASISAVFSGSPVGSLKLQISNDIVPVHPGTNIPVGTDPAGNVVNWSDYTGSSENVTTNGNFTWNLGEAGYRWVRVVYTKVSGTGTLNVYFSEKGV
jgi:hypothetical protein